LFQIAIVLSTRCAVGSMPATVLRRGDAFRAPAEHHSGDPMREDPSDEGQSANVPGSF